MNFMDHLPAEIEHLLRTRVVAEFATINAQGVPIDTPTFYFPAANLSSLDIGTGLAYPPRLTVRATIPGRACS